MKLQDLHIQVFGKFLDLRLHFADGINIVLGENEAGKSTVFNVIDHLLFTPVQLKKRELERTLKRWFPAGGGDTLSAELSAVLEGGAESVRLYKRWSDNPEGMLQFSSGGTYTNSDAMAAQVEEIWGFSPETVRQVCLLRQSTLANTLPSYRSSKEVLRSLTDILHNSLIESGGVSIAGFIESLREKYNQFFCRWDRERGYPEKNRGIENPWSKNVGTVLEAWYNMKRREVEARRVEQLEDTLLSLQAEQEEKRNELAEVELFLTEYETVYNTAGNRKSLELELRETLGGMERIRQDRQLWDRTKNELKQAARERDNGKKKTGELRVQLEDRDETAKKRRRLEKYRRLEEIKTELDKFEEKLKVQPNVPEKEFHSLRDAHTAKRECEVKLQSGRIYAQISAKNNISFSFSQGMGTEEQRDLLAGNFVDIEGDGKIHFNHEDWEIDVYAGNRDFEAVKKELEKQSRQFDEICRKYQLSTVEEAENLRRNYSDLERETVRMRKLFSEERGDDVYEVLRNEVEQYGEIPELLDSTEIGREYGALNERLTALEKMITDCEKQLARLEETYGSEENLLDRHADLRGRQRELEKQLEELPKIPTPFVSSEEFLEEYKSRQKRRESLQREIFELEKSAALAVNNLPDVSLEELEEQEEDAKRGFQAALAEGETLRRILETAESIRKEIEENPYTSFINTAEEKLKAMTEQQLKYKGSSGNGGEAGSEASVRSFGVEADGSFLGGGAAGPFAGKAGPFSGAVENSRGETLEYEQLSGGTKDAVSLAIRLAMAEYYLKEKEGFLLFDDPLVEMDPRRQKAAAGLIMETAKRYQSIMFTCHPGMCDLFPAANVIELHME